MVIAIGITLPILAGHSPQALEPIHSKQLAMATTSKPLGPIVEGAPKGLQAIVDLIEGRAAKVRYAEYNGSENEQGQIGDSSAGSRQAEGRRCALSYSRG